ncbi:MAG: hypothetical protein AAF430_15160 [Myxococcota bacterium]
MTTHEAAAPRWLYGPAWDLLLGCGGAYLVVFLAIAAFGGGVMRVLPLEVLPILVLFSGVPHYGATLLRVYERPSDRRHYAFFSIWASVLVYAVFVLGVYVETVGAWMLAIYLIWSPWHYSGQNYGIALMLLGRRGVSVPPAAKRWFYASFGLSWLLVVISVQGEAPQADYAPLDVSQGLYDVVRLGLPASLQSQLMWGCFAAYVASVAVFVGLLLRRATLSDLVPAFALIGLQALWFVAPAMSRYAGWFSGLAPFSDGMAHYVFLWIAMGHSIQYIWVSSYYARGARREHRQGNYLLQIWLAGGALWGIPLFLFAPDVLGERGVDGGVALLVTAAVNLQHFVLDGAIWKLRDGPVAQVLLGARARADDETIPPRRWLRPLIAFLGLAYATYVILGALVFQFGVVRALDPPDEDKLRQSAQILTWLGRDSASVRHDLGVISYQNEHYPEAEAEFRRSLQLAPAARTSINLGLALEAQQQWRPALDAYEEALVLEPRNVDGLRNAAKLWVRLGSLGMAEQRIQQALAVVPRQPDMRQLLRRIRQARGAGVGPSQAPSSQMR